MAHFRLPQPAFFCAIYNFIYKFSPAHIFLSPFLFPFSRLSPLLCRSAFSPHPIPLGVKMRPVVRLAGERGRKWMDWGCRGGEGHLQMFLPHLSTFFTLTPILPSSKATSPTAKAAVPNPSFSPHISLPSFPLFHWPCPFRH